jgi:hypothetical protein
VKCKKNRKCALDGRHGGSCQDKSGHLIPGVKPVTVLKVTGYGKDGKPEFSKYHV